MVGGRQSSMASVQAEERTERSQPDVARFYDATRWEYRTFWHSNSMHYGFHASRLEPLSVAIENSNRYYADRLGPSVERVLVVGCGMGGFCRELADRGLDVTGIDLSERALRDADDHVETGAFAVADYHRLPFGDDAFDAVVGIETVCHCVEYALALDELLRVARDRVLVSDGWLTADLDPRDTRCDVRRMLEGWRIDHLSTWSGFESLLEARDLQYDWVDHTDWVLPSSERQVLLSLIGVPLFYLAMLLGLKAEDSYRQAWTLYHQWRCLSRRTMRHGDFLIRVPSDDG